MNGASTVSARFTLERANLRDHNPALQSLDERMVRQLRERYLVLCPAAAVMLNGQPTGEAGAAVHAKPPSVKGKAADA
jgi:hypothetical protein